MTVRLGATVCIVAITLALACLQPSDNFRIRHVFRRHQIRQRNSAVNGTKADAYVNPRSKVLHGTDDEDFDWKAHVRFFVLGIQKGGTTSLYKYMQQHPQIQVPARKETRCFQVDFKANDPFCERYFANPKFRERHPQYLTGDFSPGYLWKTEWAIPRVKAAYPEARFIVTLRHPIERAFSQYRMHTRNQGFPKDISFRYENVTFETTCMDELEVMRKKGMLPFWNFDDRVDDDSLSLQERVEVYARASVNLTKFATFFGSTAMVQAWKNLLRQKTMSRGMVQKGLYAVELFRWMQAFPREQFLVISLEETSQHTESVMQRIHLHLAIPHVPISDAAPVNTATDIITEDVSQQMSEVLTKLYTPFDNMLSVVLDDDEWHTPWIYNKR